MFKEPLGFINSSYLVIFHVCLILIAPILSNTFPSTLGIMPLIVCLLLPMILFWYFWLLRNHVDITLLPLAIFGFTLICAFFALVSAMKGPASDATMPAIEVPFIPLLNLFFVSYTPTAPLLASVVMYYGAITYLLAAGASMVAELIYDGALRRLLPKSFAHKLTRVDDRVDRKLFTFFDGLWVMGQNVGALYLLFTLGGLALLYAITAVIV